MKTNQLQIHKLTVLSMMIALDVVLTPIFRVEGMAPMSSVVNILAGTIMGPVYALVMATATAFYPYDNTRNSSFGPNRSYLWSSTSRTLYKYGRKFYFSALGENHRYRNHRLYCLLSCYGIFHRLSCKTQLVYLHTTIYRSYLDRDSHSFCIISILITQKFF